MNYCFFCCCRFCRCSCFSDDACCFVPSEAENIIMIELDMPNRTTRDYEGPAVAPKVQAALDAALQDEEDLTLDAE